MGGRDYLLLFCCVSHISRCRCERKMWSSPPLLSCANRMYPHLLLSVWIDEFFFPRSFTSSSLFSGFLHHQNLLQNFYTFFFYL